MCLHRRVAPVFVLVISLALPAAAQSPRAAEPAAAGPRWLELWQNLIAPYLIAPFNVLTTDGRGIWDPNGDPSS